ncbi:MAG: SPOR domain-containing protein [Brumimicrobium sp.]|nr:SPOR domain-containing protein [Brumimicrobium sp.]
MDKFIKQLLLAYSKVILPGFGAIVFENEETGELMFNEHLTYNDHKLEELVEKESNMNIQEAQNAVNKFIRDLQYQLDKGDTYSIFQLGEFSKVDGTYLFKGNIERERNISPATVSDIIENEETPIEKVEDSSSVVSMFANFTPMEEETPVLKDEISFSTEDLEEMPSQTVNDSTPEVSFEEPVQEIPQGEHSKQNIYVPPVNVETETPQEESIQKEPEVKEIPKEEKPIKKPLKNKKENKYKESRSKLTKSENEKGKGKKSPLFWILLFILVTIGGLSIYGAFNYEKIEAWMGWDKFKTVPAPENKVIPQETEEKDNVETNSSQETPEESSSSTESVTTDQDTPPTNEIENSTPSSGDYHIIVGGFSDPANAERLVNELKSKGLDATIISGKSGLTQVSAQSYATLEEAKANVETVKEKSGVSGWILKH